MLSIWREEKETEVPITKMDSSPFNISIGLELFKRESEEGKGNTDILELACVLTADTDDEPGGGTMTA